MLEHRFRAMRCRQPLHQRQNRYRNQRANQSGDTQAVEQGGIDRQGLQRFGDVLRHAGIGRHNAAEILRDTCGDVVGAHHETTHAGGGIARNHGQAERADQQLTERDGAVSPDHQPRRHLASVIGEMARCAVDEETGGDNDKAERKFAGDREILLVAPCR